jgi:hypothetical protein
MSELTQSGQHPDADQLSAFAEQALPPHEREQTLAHLAVCGDCRAIVALSLPPVDESPAPRPEPARRPWFAGWNLAWPAAALAALAAVSFFVIHLRNGAAGKSSTSAPAQMADAHPPAAPVAQNAPPMPMASPPVSPSAANTLAQNRVGASAGATADLKPPAPGVADKGQSVVAQPIQNRDAPAPTRAQAAPTAGMFGGQMALHGAAVGRPQSPPTNLADSAQTNLFSAGGTAAAAPSLAPAPAKVPAPTMAAAPPPPAPQVAVDGLSDDATANASATTLAGNGVAPVASAPAATPGFTLRVTSNIALPSHLPALSSAANGHQIVAIDTQNTLFYSDDDGQHWATVPTQWRGRAVRVNLARPGSPSVAATGSLAASGFDANGGPVTAAAGVAGATLTGTVSDVSGAAISGASITVSNSATKAARTVQSDRNGRYLADNLTPGSYQIEAKAPGFSTLQLAAVTVAAAQQNLANLTLSVGAVSETVAVEAEVAAMPLAVPRAAPRAAAKKAAPAAPAKPAVPLFEITTDNGDRWTSADGKIWTQK